MKNINNMIANAGWNTFHKSAYESRNLREYGKVMHRIMCKITHCDKTNRKHDWNEVIFEDDFMLKSCGKLAQYLKLRRTDGTLYTPTVQTAELFFLYAFAKRVNATEKSRFEVTIIPAENRVVISRKKYSLGAGSGDTYAVKAVDGFKDMKPAKKVDTAELKNELENIATEIVDAVNAIQ